MDPLEKYKEQILLIDKFVKDLDPAVRGEAFRFLLEKAVLPTPDEPSLKSGSLSPEALLDEAEQVFRRLSEDSGVPAERLTEVYTYLDSSVQIIDSSIANEGPTDLVKKITLLCTYGNIVGRKIATVELSAIYKNLRNLKAATTSYSRDVKATHGVKVVATGVMLPPDGRENARAMLRGILKVSA